MSSDGVGNNKPAQGSVSHCLNCGAGLYGKYCYNCGQKAIERKDRTVGAYIKNFFEESFSFDSKFFRSLKLLIIKPGFLTVEYLQGRVTSYATPMKLYLFISIAAFFIGSLISADSLNDFRTDFKDFGSDTFVDNYISKTGVPYEIFEERYNSQLEGKLPLYFLVLVVAFSLPLKLIYITHKRYYVEHLVFSIHFFAFLLVVSVVSTVLELVVEGITGFFFFIFPFFYLFPALKRVYGQKFMLTLFETIILFIYYCILLTLTVAGAFFVTLFLV